MAWPPDRLPDSQMLIRSRIKVDGLVFGSGDDPTPALEEMRAAGFQLSQLKMITSTDRFTTEELKEIGKYTLHEFKGEMAAGGGLHDRVVALLTRPPPL